MSDFDCLVLKALSIAKMLSEKICIPRRLVRNQNASASIFYISMAGVYKEDLNGKVSLDARGLRGCGAGRGSSPSH